MGETGLNEGAKTGAATRRKSGFWRVFKWAALAGGGGLVLLLGLLVAIAVPDLRREIPPPEISGPDRVASNSSDLSTSSTSRTQSGGDSTSGTSAVLNLDDFPHLSPTMRSLTQAWLDQCAETDQALDRISDPTLRAQAAVLLENRGKMHALLDFPMEWDKFEWIEGFNQINKLRVKPFGELSVYFSLSKLRDPHCNLEDRIALEVEKIEFRFYTSRAINQKINRNEQALLSVMKGCPEFVIAFSKEMPKVDSIKRRMHIELAVHHRKWLQVTKEGFYNEAWGWDLNHILPGESLYVSRDEEAYALRQLGIRGGVGLVTRSCEVALKSHMENRIPRPLYNATQRIGDLAMFRLIVRPEYKEWEDETALLKEKQTQQDRATSGSETVKYEDLPTRATSATLETGN
jgi:hypothetical protein